MLERQVLIVGSGAREHTLGKAIEKSPGTTVFYAPGNGGTENNLPIGPGDIDRLVAFSADHDIDLTVVSREDSLEAGLVNAFQEADLPAFGTTREAAQIETSKGWATGFFERHGIPHAATTIVHDIDVAEHFIRDSWDGHVIKADGLAGGKGVYLPGSREEAKDAVRRLMVDRELGDAGATVLFQERLKGPEVSLVAFTDGTTVVPLIPAADHKRLLENDEGPNTGGMGAFAPVPYFDAAMLQSAHHEILQPIVDGMREEGILYQGALFAGLMETDQGHKVIEVNARPGDPETQAQIAMLDGELLPILQTCVNGTLDKARVKFKRGAAVCVVLAERDYPEKKSAGHEIHNLDAVLRDPRAAFFHAGTVRANGGVITTSGRILGVTAFDKDVESAARRAYGLIGKENGGVYFEGMRFRPDIGRKAALNGF